MSPFRTSPPDLESDARAGAPRRRPRRVIVAGVLVGSVALHVGVLLASALLTPPPPPGPRTAQVLPFAAVRDPMGGVTGMHNAGGTRTARIGPDPAGLPR